MRGRRPVQSSGEKAKWVGDDMSEVAEEEATFSHRRPSPCPIRVQLQPNRKPLTLKVDTGASVFTKNWERSSLNSTYKNQECHLGPTRPRRSLWPEKQKKTLIHCMWSKEMVLHYWVEISSSESDCIGRRLVWQPLMPQMLMLCWRSMVMFSRMKGPWTPSRPSLRWRVMLYQNSTVHAPYHSHWKKPLKMSCKDLRTQKYSRKLVTEIGQHRSSQLQRKMAKCDCVEIVRWQL